MRISPSYKLAGIIWILLIYCIFQMSPFKAKAYSYNDISSILNKTVITESKLVDGWDKSGIQISEISYDLVTLTALYNESYSKINELTPASGSQKALQSDAAAALNTLKTSSSLAKQYLENNDNNGFAAAMRTHDEGIDAINSVIRRVNTEFNITTTDNSAFLGMLSVIFCSITIGLFIASRIGNNLLESAIRQNELQFELFKISLWPTIGSFGSWIWYELTPPGGTYYLLWGPIIFGGMVFIKGYFDYWRQKKSIKKMQNDETLQIRNLIKKDSISSDLRNKDNGLSDWESIKRKV